MINNFYNIANPFEEINYSEANETDTAYSSTNISDNQSMIFQFFRKHKFNTPSSDKAIRNKNNNSRNSEDRKSVPTRKTNSKDLKEEKYNEEQQLIFNIEEFIQPSPQQENANNNTILEEHSINSKNESSENKIKEQENNCEVTQKQDETLNHKKKNKKKKQQKFKRVNNIKKSFISQASLKKNSDHCEKTNQLDQENHNPNKKEDQASEGLNLNSEEANFKPKKLKEVKETNREKQTANSGLKLKKQKSYNNFCEVFPIGHDPSCNELDRKNFSVNQNFKLTNSNNIVHLPPNRIDNVGFFNQNRFFNMFPIHYPTGDYNYMMFNKLQAQYLGYATYPYYTQLSYSPKLFNFYEKLQIHITEYSNKVIKINKKLKEVKINCLNHILSILKRELSKF